MAYTSAKVGQVVYWATNPFAEREAVEFVRYYKDRKDLVYPNCAVINSNGVHIHVSINNLYRKQVQR